MTRGTLQDSYVAALRHELVELEPKTTRVGVVRKPTPWFHAAVDENVPELGPPASLLEETKQAEDQLKLRGVCDEEAHNAAWEDVDFAGRYRRHLHDADDARSALDALDRRLADGESLALVCYENTATKRCHRTILAEVLAGRA